MPTVFSSEQSVWKRCGVVRISCTWLSLLVKRTRWPSAIRGAAFETPLAYQLVDPTPGGSLEVTARIRSRRFSPVLWVLEYAAGYAVIAHLSAEAILLVLARARTNIGPLLYDLTRHRAEIAGLL